MSEFSPYDDPAYEPALHIYMVDPNNYSKNGKELTGVTKCTMTDGYYSDTKVSAAVTTIADNYQMGRWLRIYVDKIAMGTFGVTAIKTTRAPEGGSQREYTLQSILWMLNDDIAYGGFTVKKGVKIQSVIQNLCNQRKKQVSFTPGWHSTSMGSVRVYEKTESYRSILADLASAGKNQLGVSPMGKITISAYVEPGRKNVVKTLDENDPRSIILEPGWDEDFPIGSGYNRTVVLIDGGDSGFVTARKDVPSSSSLSYNRLGWIRTNVHTLSAGQDESKAKMQQRANNSLNGYYNSDRVVGVTRETTTMWYPFHSGDVVSWHRGSTAVGHYLLQTIEHDFFAWTCRLTLKKV